MTSPLPPLPITCAELQAALPAYAAGTLAEDAAWRLEWHAAHCGTCEPLLSTNAPSLSLPGPEPETHVAMRDEVCARVRATRRTAAPWRRWVPLSALAAAAALAIIFAPARPVRDVVAPDATPMFDPSASAPMVSARKLAESQAAVEFEALDVAERELAADLRAAPDDSELQRFHETLDARRRELSERIMSVTQ